MTELPPNQPPNEPPGVPPTGPTPPPAGFDQAPPPGQPGGAGSPPTGPGRRSNTPLIIGIILAVAVLVGGGILLLADGDDDDDSTETSETEDTIEDLEDEDTTGSSEDNEEPSGDGAAVENAEAVVQEYFDAVLDQDCGAMLGTITESSWSSEVGSVEEAQDQCQTAVDAGELNFDGEITLDNLEVLDQSADSVTFEATETVAGEEIVETFTVVNQDGEWRIDLNQ